MRVLCLASSLPTVTNPQMGIFVKEQVDSLRHLGLEIEILNIKGYENKLNYSKAIRQMRKIIHSQQIDLIHAHYGLSGLVACFQSAIPFIVTFQGGEILGLPSKSGWFINSILARLNKVIVHRAGGVIVQSVEMKTKLDYHHAQIIPFGVDLNLFRLIERVQACRQLGLDSTRKRILFANNPAIRLKHFDIARKAFELVKDDKPETDLVVTGKVSREKMPLYMNACDVLILTSLFEGSPMVVKEAMACNMPIVSVDVGDVREVIDKTKNCFITSRNPGEIAKRIIQIFDSNERAGGRENIRRLEIGNIAQRIMAFYKRVCPDAN